MAEYPRRLDDRVRAEIAIKINLGYSRDELAKRYGETTSGIVTIASERSRWLPKGDITRTSAEKFQYAQKIFADDSSIADLINGASIEELRKDIRNRFMGPVGDGIVEGFDQDPFRNLIRDIFESYPVGTTPDVYDDYLGKVRELALEALRQHASQGKLYGNIDDAVKGIAPDVEKKEKELEHEYKRAEVEVKARIYNALNQLPTRWKDIIQLSYGLKDGNQKKPMQIRDYFDEKGLADITRQAIEKSKKKALRDLRKSLRGPKHQ